MSTKQYRSVGPVVQHPPVWVGKKRATFAGAKPANDVLKHHAQSFPARFAKLMRRAI